MDIEYVATPPAPVVPVPVAAAGPAPTGGGRRFGLLAALAMTLVVAASVALFSALMGPTVVDGSATAPPVQYRQLTIEFDLYDDSSRNFSDCSGGDGGYSDIGPGMPITVRNQSGDVVASTFIPSSGEAHPGGYGCVWTMRVEVPMHIQHAVITGGRRGEITYSRSDLIANDWTAFLSMGH
jgi:hypothetical protein